MSREHEFNAGEKIARAWIRMGWTTLRPQPSIASGRKGTIVGRACSTPVARSIVSRSNPMWDMVLVQFHCATGDDLSSCKETGGEEVV